MLASQTVYFPEFRQHGQDRQDAHECQIRQWVDQFAPGSSHPFPAKSGDGDARFTLTQAADQVGAVKVAAGLAGADEQMHGSFPAGGDGPVHP